MVDDPITLQCPSTIELASTSYFPFFVLCADYPYCLAGKELRGVIKGLIGRCSDTLPDFFDHCVSTMLRELDRQTGKRASDAVKCPMLKWPI